MISGLTILRNGIECGYTFVETIQTLSQICDEVIVCEGHSTDNTWEVLNNIKTDKIKLYRDHWQQSTNGLEFARITNIGLSRCSGDYIFYLQADELIHEKDYDHIKNLINSNQHNSIHFHFVHLRYDIRKKIANDAYTSAIRVIRSNAGIHSESDGYNFIGNVHPGIESGVVVYHAGYVFLRNILLKMINHSKIYYVGNSNYKDRANTAKKLLDRLNTGQHVSPEEAHQALEPFYGVVPHGLPIPKLLEKHLDKLEYTV